MHKYIHWYCRLLCARLQAKLSEGQLQSSALFHVAPMKSENKMSWPLVINLILSIMHIEISACVTYLSIVSLNGVAYLILHWPVAA